MSEMREFLMGLYLLHGEREFELEMEWDNNHMNAFDEYYISHFKGDQLLINSTNSTYLFYLTPKALEYIKNLDNE